jgi:hypothetical protein
VKRAVLIIYFNDINCPTKRWTIRESFIRTGRLNRRFDVKLDKQPRSVKNRFLEIRIAEIIPVEFA